MNIRLELYASCYAWTKVHPNGVLCFRGFLFPNVLDCGSYRLNTQLGFNSQRIDKGLPLSKSRFFSFQNLIKSFLYISSYSFDNFKLYLYMRNARHAIN